MKTFLLISAAYFYTHVFVQADEAEEKPPYSACYDYLRSDSQYLSCLESNPECTSNPALCYNKDAEYFFSSENETNIRRTVFLDTCTSHSHCSNGQGCLLGDDDHFPDELANILDNLEESETLKAMDVDEIGGACQGHSQCASLKCVGGQCAQSRFCRYADEGELAPSGVRCNVGLEKNESTSICEQKPRDLSALNDILNHLSNSNSCNLKLNEQHARNLQELTLNLRSLELMFHLGEPEEKDRFGMKESITKTMNQLAHQRKAISGRLNEKLQDIFVELNTLKTLDRRSNEKVVFLGEEIAQRTLASRLGNGKDIFRLMEKFELAKADYEEEMAALYSGLAKDGFGNGSEKAHSLRRFFDDFVAVKHNSTTARFADQKDTSRTRKNKRKQRYIWRMKQGGTRSHLYAGANRVEERYIKNVGALNSIDERTMWWLDPMLPKRASDLGVKPNFIRRKGNTNLGRVVTAVPSGGTVFLLKENKATLRDSDVKDFYDKVEKEWEEKLHQYYASLVKGMDKERLEKNDKLLVDPDLDLSAYCAYRKVNNTDIESEEESGSLLDNYSSQGSSSASTSNQASDQRCRDYDQRIKQMAKRMFTQSYIYAAHRKNKLRRYFDGSSSSTRNEEFTTILGNTEVITALQAKGKDLAPRAKLLAYTYNDAIYLSKIYQSKAAKRRDIFSTEESAKSDGYAMQKNECFQKLVFGDGTDFNGGDRQRGNQGGDFGRINNDLFSGGAGSGGVVFKGNPFITRAQRQGGPENDPTMGQIRASGGARRSLAGANQGTGTGEETSQSRGMGMGRGESELDSNVGQNAVNVDSVARDGKAINQADGKKHHQRQFGNQANDSLSSFAGFGDYGESSQGPSGGVVMNNDEAEDLLQRAKHYQARGESIFDHITKAYVKEGYPRVLKPAKRTPASLQSGEAGRQKKALVNGLRNF